jgi:two-component system NtrC family response regulator
MEHGWPGNVRELANVVERLVLLAEEGRPSVEDLPTEMSRSAAGEEGCPCSLPADGLVWEKVERGMMRQALERSQGNRAAAARLMGLGYKAFLYRLEKHGMGSNGGEVVAKSPEMGS